MERTADESEEENFELNKINMKKKILNQNRKKKKSGGFQVMGLGYAAYKGIMKKGYKVPTPIQRKSIPTILDGKDVVAMARTGSGKTAAFLVPMFEKLQIHSAKTGSRALILSPTRELALQTLKFTKELGRFTDLKSAVVLGGDKMESQFSALHENPDIIIATPGRFLHLIMEMDLKLSSVEYVVFDEADRLFEMGFSEQLLEIISRLPEARQTLLFSATLPKTIVEFAKAGLNDPILIRLDVDTKLSQQLKLAFFSVRADDKSAVLLHLLQSVIKPKEQTMIFAATRHHVEYLKTLLTLANIPCSCVYSALDQTARKINVAKFRKRKVMVIIATDVAARGIDIPLLDNVINYNFPGKSKLFVHRVGRVARAGRLGAAYSLIASDEVAYMLDLLLFLGKPLQNAKEDYDENDEKDFVYGSVPQSIIDDQEDILRNIHQHSTDLVAQKEICVKAYKQYLKSRPPPAPESVKRMKEMSLVPPRVHPLLGGNEELTCAKFIDGIRAYKTKQTIFEICATSKTRSQDIMKSKRQKHGVVIEKVKQNTEQKTTAEKSERRIAKSQNEPTQEDIKGVFTTVVDHARKKRRTNQTGTGEFRDDNYIPHRAPDHYSERGLGMSSFQNEAANAVLDMDGDETRDMRKCKQSKRWDRKRKRFVGNEDNAKKKIKTESGRLIPASYKRDYYKEWLERNLTKQREEPGEDDDRRNQNTHFKGKGKGKRGPNGFGGKNKPHKNELRNKDQILKQRKTRERLLERQKKGKNKNKRKQNRKG